LASGQLRVIGHKYLVARLQAIQMLRLLLQFNPLSQRLLLCVACCPVLCNLLAPDFLLLSAAVLVSVVGLQV